MSKRFGRNQKRKMREKLNELEYSLKKEERNKANLYRIKDNFEHLVRMIERRFPNAICLPAKETDFDPYSSQIRIPIMPDMAFTVGDNSPMHLIYDEAKLDEFEMFIEKLEDKHALGFHVICKNSKYRYFIDLNYVREYGFNSEELSRKITREIVTTLQRNAYKF